MEYMKVSQAAEKWGISARRVRALCAEGKIDGVIRKGKLYLIPIDAQKPQDGRISKKDKNENVESAPLVIPEFTYPDTVKNLTAGLTAMQNAMNSLVYSHAQKLVTVSQSLGAAVASMIQSEAMQAVLNVGQSIANMIATIDFTPMLKNFSEAIVPITYIHLLERLNWPIFLIEDEQLRKDILTACKTNEDPAIVAEIIYKYCTDDFFIAVEDDWMNCSIISEGRKPILSQAIYLHKQEFYFASTSMLMCQLYGIAADIEKALEGNNLTLNQEEKEYVAELFNLNSKFIDKEKGRLFQTLMFTESGMLLWNAMANYLRDVCFFSGQDYSHINNQPLRNKICHGDQIEFGTQEHSLKAIFVIDMLIQLAYEIKRIIDIKEQDNQDVED